MVPVILKMSDTFDELTSHTAFFDKPLKTYLKNSVHDFNETKLMEQDTIHSMIAKFEKQLDKVSKLDVRQTVKLYKLDGDKLKKELRES